MNFHHQSLHEMTTNPKGSGWSVCLSRWSGWSCGCCSLWRAWHCGEAPGCGWGPSQWQMWRAPGHVWHQRCSHHSGCEGDPHQVKRKSRWVIQKPLTQLSDSSGVVDGWISVAFVLCIQSTHRFYCSALLELDGKLIPRESLSTCAYTSPKNLTKMHRDIFCPKYHSVLMFMNLNEITGCFVWTKFDAVSGLSQHSMYFPVHFLSSWCNITFLEEYTWCSFYPSWEYGFGAEIKILQITTLCAAYFHSQVASEAYIYFQLRMSVFGSWKKKKKTFLSQVKLQRNLFRL